MKSRNASSIVFLLIKCNNVSDRIGLIAADKMVHCINHPSTDLLRRVFFSKPQMCSMKWRIVTSHKTNHHFSTASN